MIDAKELMLGNWANYGNEPTQITTVWLTYIEYWGSHVASKKKPLPEKMFSPIPLTEGWLLEFGINEIIKLDIGIWNNGDAIYLMYGNERSVSLKYVHQLQNLYFALTGEELKTESK